MSINENDNSQKIVENYIILPDLLWVFRQEKYQSKEEFSQQVKKYQVDITDQDNWKPGEIIFDERVINIIADFDWETPPDDRIEFSFQSDNAAGFTALDLLFRLNNFLADYDLGDSQFFEGLKYIPQNKQYLLKLGS